MSNLRLIVYLSLATLIAIGANFFLAWQKPNARSLQNKTLIDPALEVTSITISRPGEPSVILSKDNRWRLTAPFGGNVNERIVLRMLDAFAYSTIGDVMPESELVKLGRTREDFDLVEPRLTITIASESEATEISFGSETPITNSVYAVRGGSNTILAVPREVFDAANIKSDQLRNRNVFTHDPESITGFDVKRPGEPPISFTNDDGIWKVGSSVASIARTQELLSLILDARAKEFIWPIGVTNESDVASSAVLSGYGLDSETALSVNLRCLDGIDRRILLGHEVGSGEIYALVHGGAAVVTLDSNLKIAAAQSLQAFMDKRLFPLEEAAVKTFSIVDGDLSFSLARSEAGAWRLDSPLSAPADPNAVKALLGRILALTPADITAHGVKVSVSSDLPTVSVYAKSVIAGQQLEDLRSREILKLDPALIKRLVATPRESHPISVVYQRERRVWSGEEHAVGKIGGVNEENVAAILAELSSLKAERIVALKVLGSDLSRYGLESPRYVLSVDQDRVESVRRNILIGDETEGGSFATVGSAESVFVLSPETVEVLTAPLIGE